MKNKFCFFILTLLTTCFISSFCLKLINKKDILLKGKYLIKYLSYLDSYDYVIKNNCEEDVDIISPYPDLQVLSKSTDVNCITCNNTDDISVIPDEKTNTVNIEPVQHINSSKLNKDKEIKEGSHSTSKEDKEKNIYYKSTFKFKLDNNKENKDKKVFIGTPDMNIRYRVIFIDEKKFNDFEKFNNLNLSSNFLKVKIYQKSKNKFK